MARRGVIPEWIREAYLSLAIRGPGLKTADAQALGAAATSIIARAREEILLHRLQTLTLEDPATRQSTCNSPSRACREATCEARLALSARNRRLPKPEAELARLFLKEVSNLGQKLCDACKADGKLGRMVLALDEEINVARKVFEDELGQDDSKWLETV